MTDHLHPVSIESPSNTLVPKRPSLWRHPTLAALLGVFAGVLLAASLSRAQVDGASPEGIPPMDGKSLEGEIIDEADGVIDDLGNTRLDLSPSAKEPEALPPELEKRLDELSALRAAQGADDDGEILEIPPLNDASVPPRMDAGTDDPDRLTAAADSVAIEEVPVPPLEALALEPPATDLPAEASAAPSTGSFGVAP